MTRPERHTGRSVQIGARQHFAQSVPRRGMNHNYELRVPRRSMNYLKG